MVCRVAKARSGVASDGQGVDSFLSQMPASHTSSLQGPQRFCPGSD